MISETSDGTPVKVAIVDDSRSIRRWLRLVLDSDARLRVVGEASCGEEARDLLRETAVDVMTLDVDMPGMSGLEFLRRLMTHKPMPVVMFSALTEEGSQEAIQALSLGAVDCMEKPRSARQSHVANDLCDRVWLASQSQAHGSGFRRIKAVQRRDKSGQEPWFGDIILLGASTGGVSALEALLYELDGNETPIVIAQHMPENFLRSFCRRLNQQFSRRFLLAEHGREVLSNQAVIALGKTVSTRLRKGSDGRMVCELSTPSEAALFRPSIDDLFHSAAQENLRGSAAVLTGMGTDGAEGLLALRQVGFKTFAQDENSCVVYGMPRAAMETGAAPKAMSPDEIGRNMLRHAQTNLPIKQGA